MLSINQYIELSMTILLAITIVYCLILNRKLTRLRADETTLKSTIQQLICATGIAQQAIDELHTTVSHYEQSLANPISEAENVLVTLDEKIKTATILLEQPIPNSSENSQPMTHNPESISDFSKTASGVIERLQSLKINHQNKSAA